MDITAEMSGFFAAHAVWSVADGSTFAPMLAFERPDGSRELRVLDGDDLQDSLDSGHEWLAGNPEDATRAVLIYDGLITLESGQTDALLLEARQYAPQQSYLDVITPYATAGESTPFTIQSPRFLMPGDAAANSATLADAFFRGVNGHPQAATVWSEHLEGAQ